MKKFPISETARIKLRATVPPIFPASGFIRLGQFKELDPFTVVFMLADFSTVVFSRDMLPLKNIYSSNNGLIYSLIIIITKLSNLIGYQLP